MDLFSKFKKDYVNYLLSVIFPALIMFCSIPIFKRMLGANGYGDFAIWVSAVLLVSTTLGGWIFQSILRFYPGSTNKSVFTKQAIAICYRTQLYICIPVFLLVWYLKNDVFAALLFVFALFSTSMQFSILSISQSSFLSKKNIYSESIRATSYIGVALTLLIFFKMHYWYALFIAVIISYSLSAFYLYKQNSRTVTKNEPTPIPQENSKELALQFFKYGGPLSLWFIFNYMSSFADKLFMLKNSGQVFQGNYQAIFDLLSRTLVVLISPVTTALFPLLIISYKEGRADEIKNLLKKIIVIELGLFVLTSILYWWFGSDIVLNILHTPSTYSYKLMGFIVIAGTFSWLIAMVAHKRFELRLQTHFLLAMIACAFVFQISLYVIFRKYNNPILYPLGYLVSGIVYLLLVSFSKEIKPFRKFLRPDKN